MSLSERTDDVRERLLDSALTLAAEHGIAGVTAKRVGLTAGLNGSAVDQVFGSRAALIEEVIAREIRRWGRLASTIPPQTSAVGVLDVHWETFLTASRNRRVLIMIFGEGLTTSSAEVRTTIASCQDRVRAYVTRRLVETDDPQLSSGEALRAAGAFMMAAVLGVILRGELETEADVQASYLDLRDSIMSRWPAREDLVPLEGGDTDL